MSLGFVKVDMADLKIWEQIRLGKWNNRALLPSSLGDLVASMRINGVYTLSKEMRFQFLLYIDDLDGVAPVTDIDLNTAQMADLPLLKLKDSVIIYAAGGNHRKASILQYLQELLQTKQTILNFIETASAKVLKSSKMRQKINEGKATVERLDATYEASRYMAVELYDYGV